MNKFLTILILVFSVNSFSDDHAGGLKPSSLTGEFYFFSVTVQLNLLEHWINLILQLVLKSGEKNQVSTQVYIRQQEANIPT